MKKLTILVGPPGSGKSTVAKECYDTYVYINQDKQGKEGHLKLFQEALLESKDVVVDRLNFNKIQRERYLKPAKELGYSTEIVVLHECFKICFERCMARKDHETIHDKSDASSALNMFFSKYERVQDNEADSVTRSWPKGDFPPAIWIDVDNTLSDANHREHYLQGDRKNWKAFFAEMSKDPVNEWCKTLVEGMIGVCQILIVSARPDNYRDQTESWLKINFVPYDELIMRNRGDSRKDSIVKELIYEFEIKTQYRLLFSVDDRKQVIDQMRTHGIIVLDCAGEKGNF